MGGTMTKTTLLLIALVTLGNACALDLGETPLFENETAQQVWLKVAEDNGLDPACAADTSIQVSFVGFETTQDYCNAPGSNSVRYGCTYEGDNILFVSTERDYTDADGNVTYPARDNTRVWYTIIHERLHQYLACANDNIDAQHEHHLFRDVSSGRFARDYGHMVNHINPAEL